MESISRLDGKGRSLAKVTVTLSVEKQVVLVLRSLTVNAGTAVCVVNDFAFVTFPDQL
ncbi:hypothetical protein MASR1M65_12230 [Saprospiraceae bacterium]